MTKSKTLSKLCEVLFLAVALSSAFVLNFHTNVEATPTFPMKSNSIRDMRMGEASLSVELRQHHNGNSENKNGNSGTIGTGTGSSSIMKQGSKVDDRIPSMRQIKRRDLSSQDEYEEVLPNVDRILYPMLVSKKSATALNKLIYALKSSLDSASVENQDPASPQRAAAGLALPLSSFKSIRDVQLPENSNFFYDPYNQHLQRRGQQKDRKNYLRCYFNAVSCF